jgi:hypothetical protein
MIRARKPAMVNRMSGKNGDSGWSRLFDTAFRRSQNPMALTDGHGRLVRINPAMSQLLG